jgi:hypothetical protein
MRHEIRSIPANRHSYNTLHPSYSERVGAVKTVYNNRVFTKKIFNLTIN